MYLRVQMDLAPPGNHSDLDRLPKAVALNSRVWLRHGFPSREDTASQLLLRRPVKRQRRTATSLRVESVVSSDRRARVMLRQAI